jgi:LemA protein
MTLLIPVIILAVFVILVLLVYNSLIRARNKVSEAWSGIDIQLKRRTDLIPNLVETVKGYVKHEQGVLEQVTRARAGLLDAKGPEDLAAANDLLTKTLRSLFAVAEDYPQLKASDNFLNLQQQLGDTEDRIAYSRQYYNSIVLDYNTKVKTFPSIILAGAVGLKEIEFFKATKEDTTDVKVNF